MYTPEWIGKKVRFKVLWDEDDLLFIPYINKDEIYEGIIIKEKHGCKNCIEYIRKTPDGNITDYADLAEVEFMEYYQFLYEYN